MSVVVMTGGGSGIGRACVDAFVAAGHHVAVLDRDADKVAALPDGVLGIVGDATTEDANRDVVYEAARRWGGVDHVITFVGVFDLNRPLVEIPSDRFGAAWDEVFGVNVLSPMLTARAAVPQLRRSKGSIVFTCSSSSFYAGRGGSLYVASKFALRGLVVQLGHELAPEVRVNGVAPGGTVGTDLRGPSSLGLQDVRLDDRPGREDGIRARTPLHVAMAPADHAGAYLFLCSDGAKGMTGEIIRSDGGMAVR